MKTRLPIRVHRLKDYFGLAMTADEDPFAIKMYQKKNINSPPNDGG